MKFILFFFMISTTTCIGQWAESGNTINTVNTAASVGIGTSTPGAKLHISSGGFRHGGTGEISIDGPGVIGGRFKILDNGNVGINNANPQSKLDINVSNGKGINVSGNNNSFAVADINISRSNSSSSVGMAASLQFNDESTLSQNIIQGSLAGLQFFNNYNNGGWIEQVRIASNGFVGIGTSNPGQRLEVNGDISVGSNGGILTGRGASLVFQGADGNSDQLTAFRYNLSTNSSELRVSIGDDNGGEDAFVVGNTFSGDGQWKTFLKVRNDGNVGIGTTNPDAKLAVKGTVHANEVKVDLNVPGPDYVFERNYSLPSLDSVQTYINQNKHLPEVPSAKEMEANGVNVGEMNMLLLKKIEELTLYMIEIKAENEKHQKVNARQQKQIDELKSKIK